MNKKVTKYLHHVIDEKGAGYFILIDPDTRKEKDLRSFVKQVNSAGVDGILVGGSLLLGSDFSRTVKIVKEESNTPVIIFPGSTQQVSPDADAILFISLISGRNPNYLIGDQVLAAPTIKKINLETIPTGYMLFQCGRTTTAEYMSNTKPLPPHKPEIAVAHALAAQYMGMEYVYLEAGSGADHPIPADIIQKVSSHISIPIITGGGIRKPAQAAERVNSGAKFIVTGNLFNAQNDPDLMNKFAEAIHYKGK
ncbi:MAG: geranylgeranylglyceryl/heptaprenylglyceryl phosphate synthase [Candidatus Marinimicrobia bacterium]|nr:geranylgeranylglyceryl/heptaprenylglyceryl phosphate synthase [Candidatus Neomarinimicrobiota bacterium]